MDAASRAKLVNDPLNLIVVPTYEVNDSQTGVGDGPLRNPLLASTNCSPNSFTMG